MLFIQQTKPFPWLHVGFCYQWELFHIYDLKFIHSDVQPQLMTRSSFPVPAIPLLSPVETASLFLSVSSNQTASLTSLTPKIGGCFFKEDASSFSHLIHHALLLGPHAACTSPEQVESTHLLVLLQLRVCQVTAVETRMMQNGPGTDLQFLVSAYPKSIHVREASGQPPSLVRLSEFLPLSQLLPVCPLSQQMPSCLPSW